MKKSFASQVKNQISARLFGQNGNGSREAEYDVVIIGSGGGGMAAAARLSLAGVQTELQNRLAAWMRDVGVKRSSAPGALGPPPVAILLGDSIRLNPISP